MKKLFFLVCTFTMLFGQVSAQHLVADDKNGTSTGVAVNTVNTNEATVPKGNYSMAMDLEYDYSSKLKIHSIGFGYDSRDGGYFKLDGSFGGANGIDLFSMSVGYGLVKRHIAGDVFLIQGKLYPYIGYSSIEVGDESDMEFDYGLSGSLSVGLNIWNTAKGESAFLTAGYYLCAPEFEFGDMFDNGSWGIGLTIVY